MNNSTDRFITPDQQEYSKLFLNYIRGNTEEEQHLAQGITFSGGFMLPSADDAKLRETLVQESLFRRVGTYIYKKTGPSTLFVNDSDGCASWVPEGEAIPAYEGMNDFARFPLETHKLAAAIKMDSEFLHNYPYIFLSHLIKKFARSLGRAENDGFINGTGTDTPVGLLCENGAETGVTTSSITFDDVIRLYFSVDARYRDNGSWLMNDETALTLRLLKDDAGNSLWDQATGTILGRPVLINNRMPSASQGSKPIAFGDLSYYWVIERDPAGVKVLLEKFYETGHIGYMCVERLDGRLVRPDAVKTIVIDGEGK